MRDERVGVRERLEEGDAGRELGGTIGGVKD